VSNLDFRGPEKDEIAEEVALVALEMCGLSLALGSELEEGFHDPVEEVESVADEGLGCSGLNTGGRSLAEAAEARGRSAAGGVGHLADYWAVEMSENTLAAAAVAAVVATDLSCTLDFLSVCGKRRFAAAGPLEEAADMGQDLELVAVAVSLQK